MSKRQRIERLERDVKLLFGHHNQRLAEEMDGEHERRVVDPSECVKCGERLPSCLSAEDVSSWLNHHTNGRCVSYEQRPQQASKPDEKGEKDWFEHGQVEISDNARKWFLALPIVDFNAGLARRCDRCQQVDDRGDPLKDRNAWIDYHFHAECQPSIFTKANRQEYKLSEKCLCQHDYDEHSIENGCERPFEGGQCPCTFFRIDKPADAPTSEPPIIFELGRSSTLNGVTLSAKQMFPTLCEKAEALDHCATAARVEGYELKDQIEAITQQCSTWHKVAEFAEKHWAYQRNTGTKGMMVLLHELSKNTSVKADMTTLPNGLTDTREVIEKVVGKVSNRIV